MRAAIITLTLMIGSQAWAECGNLCDSDWWKTSTAADVQAELDGGADVMARTKDGWTPLHEAALFGKPATIQALIAAGADAKAEDLVSQTPWDYAQENEKVKGTKGYWALNDAQYN